MEQIAHSFISEATQCWSCPIFDRMFQVISSASAAVYRPFAIICTALFLTVFAFYIFGAVWTNLTKGFQDGWINKSLRPVFINSIFVVAFLGMNVALPRFITTVTFEPVAYVTQTYATAVLKTTPEEIEAHVPYQPSEMSDDGIFRPELRNTIIDIAKITITQFQSFMKLGVALLDTGLSWSMFFGVGAFIKHILLAFIGLYIFWAFFKMFFRFLCYFADVIIAMALFAFFFPLSLVTTAFNDSKETDTWTGWIKNLGKGLGVDQIKSMIGAIISLGVAVITYTVILVIISRFFADPTDGTNNFDNLVAAVLDGSVFSSDLSVTSQYDFSLSTVIVLVYVLSYIYGNIPEITDMILKMFDAPKPKNPAGDEMAKNLMGATKYMYDAVKTAAKTVVNHGEAKTK